MDKIKKYKKQIFTFITIWLLLEFGIYPCLTMANTFFNLIGAIALLILILWVIVSLYDFIKDSNVSEDKNTVVEEPVVEKKPKRKSRTKNK